MSLPVLGIDLGTTNTCLSIKTEKPQIILINKHKTFPSIYNSKNNLVGHEAKQMLIKDSRNTFFATKRLIGKKFDDPEIQRYITSLPYKTFSHTNGDVWIKADKILSPIQIAARILQYGKKKAEEYLGIKIKDSVITVPAYFDDHQRQATKTAAKLAGLNVIRILNEPTAAALAYGLNKEEGIVAVYDLGGGTFDISILKIKNGIFQVLSTNGNTFLGGEDIDFKIKEFLNKKITKNNIKLDDSLLKVVSEELKVKLSLFDRVQIIFGRKTADSLDEIDRINEKIDISKQNFDNENEPNNKILVENTKFCQIEIDRNDIEKLAEEIVNKTIKPCKQAIKDAELTVSDINKIILVGGMTRMPLVRQKVKEIFNKEPILIDPDTVVAEGAAIQGYSLTNSSTHLLLDVNSLSLGIETIGGIFSPIIKRNSPYPSKKTETFTTSEDNQEEVTINIYQGERPLVKHNKFLGSLKLMIPPMKKNVPKIEVSFETDADGILKISARDALNDKVVKSELFFSSGLSDDELNSMLDEAHKNEQNDILNVKRIELRNKVNKLNDNATTKEIKKAVEDENFDIHRIEKMMQDII